MQIEIKIDEHCSEPIITVVTNKMTGELNELIKKLSEEQTQIIAGFQDDRVTLLDPSTIFRIFASNGKVYAETEERQYVIRLRLYEAEQRLSGNTFVRISNSEIVNLKKVKGFDLSFAGTICVSLTNGTVTYVSRRYVSKIKQLLGI
ncbi:MAG: LytTR family DNA-binding domain-containing protein [Candidatus Neoclostridium sp.]